MRTLGTGLGIVALLLVVGCSTSDGGPTTTADSETVSGGDDLVADVGGAEARFEPELLLPPVDVNSDLPGEDVPFTPGCEPGDGCFLDPCEENSDCQSGWCVEHLGEGVCTQTCQEECPPGWACKPVGMGGPDLGYVCVSQHSNLCKPCATSEGCKSPGGAEDACLDYGVEGNFCGGPCTGDADCPWGFSCTEAQTVDGVELKQCTADAGICPCAGKSVALGLATPCSVSNEFGHCEGKRVCTQEGLSACDAPVPAQEVCDGVDNDCDDEVDEPVLVESEYVAVCDDGNACTKDTCDGESGCTHEALDEGQCGDGDACTVGDHCEAGVCVGSPVACSDDNPCTDDVCDGLGGCDFIPNTEDCDDGNPCTVADQCDNGECTGTPVDCACQTDEDCVALEDDDLCNGTLRCNTETFPFTCVVDSGTVIECPEPEAGPDAFCQKAACDPATGECALVANFEGFACDDGDACTVGDACQDGACVPGVPPICADDNPCTDDSCDPGTGCASVPNAAVCNDGDACTVDDVCSEGTCVGGGSLDCDDQNPCTDDACDPLKGCVHAHNALACDDGNACTDGDQCKLGACLPGPPLDCDDGNQCTKDLCFQESGCVNTFIEGPCDDGNGCTTADACVNGQCVGGPPPACDDGNPCTDGACVDDGTCVYTPNQAACDDGNACTTGDHCSDGQCEYGGLTDCDDNNTCTDDVCDPKLGCIHLHNTAPCEDGSVCTFFDQCAQGVCVGGKTLVCDDENLCTDDSCDPQEGCLYVPNQAPCEDGSVCTVGDACSGGACAAGAPLDCDDQNVCTDDSCDPVDGCQYAPNDSNCDDDNVCTQDSCDPQTGCVNAPIDATCDDGVECTEDTCDAVTGCVYTPNNGACDDDIACTVDLCDAELGCVHIATDGLCDDDNACTDDTCEVETGCAFVNNNAACDDGDACTENDVCSGGSCAGTVPKVKIYDSDLGVDTMLSCGGGHDGFNYVCNYLGYGSATGLHPSGDHQSGSPCWAIGEADGYVNQKYGSCGSGCTHWQYVECYKCD